MIILISAAHAVDDSYALRLRAILKHYFATSRAYRVADSLELKACVDVG
jgi:hypothetical protein